MDQDLFVETVGFHDEDVSQYYRSSPRIRKRANILHHTVLVISFAIFDKMTASNNCATLERAPKYANPLSYK